MSTLYELNQRYMNILEVAEMMDEGLLNEALATIDDEIDDKADGYAKVIKQLELQVKGLKEEEKRLAERRKSIENNIKRMKESLEDSMKVQGKRKIKTNLFTFNIQHNPPSLKVTDESNIPEEFFEEQAPKLNRKELLKYLKNTDEKIEGAEIKQTEGLRIR